jgi:hypothetical protein
MPTRVNHQETVKAVLDAKAVDFAAIGKVVAQLGPSLSVADEPWESFCWTMKYFFHIYRPPVFPPFTFPPFPWSSLADLAQFREIAGELKGVKE